MITLRDIEEARRRLGDSIFATPCARSETFSQLCGCTTFFKLENLQMTGSFKERGALNRLLTLSPAEKERGVIAASAGNHAQGVAYHARRLGIAATIVMPEHTPLIKVTSTRRYGAVVVLHGASYDDAYAEARRLEGAGGMVFVHPFDDPLVIAGQGTLGLELIEQNPYLDVVVVPVGGGGLISGVATVFKEVNPKVRIIGVQTEALPSMKAARDAGALLTLDPAHTLADGIAVKRPGSLTFEIVRAKVDDVVLVDEEEIANAVQLLLEIEKTVVEGAAACTLAAVIHRKIDVSGKKVAMVLSGGNIDINMLGRIIERGLVKDGRLVRLRAMLLDRPGSLSRFLAQVAEKGANVMDIRHERSFADAAVGETEVELTAETRGREHIDELVRHLRGAGYAVGEMRPSRAS